MSHVDSATIRVLTKNNLNKNQALVYLTLLKLGYGSVSQIAQAAELKRPLVYLILDELKQRGVVTELLDRTIKRFAATDPRIFLNQQKSALEDLRFMMPFFLRQYEQGVPKRPWVEVVEHPSGILRLYRQFGRATKARYISSFASLRTTFPEEVQEWIHSARMGKSITPRYQIMVDEPEGRAFAEEVSICKAWNIRFLPSRMNIKINMDIIDDVVMVTHFNPLFATVTHAPSLANDYGVLFDLLWKSCTPYKKKTYPQKAR